MELSYDAIMTPVYHPPVDELDAGDDDDFSLISKFSSESDEESVYFCLCCHEHPGQCLEMHCNIHNKKKNSIVL